MRYPAVVVASAAAEAAVIAVPIPAAAAAAAQSTAFITAFDTVTASETDAAAVTADVGAVTVSSITATSPTT